MVLGKGERGTDMQPMCPLTGPRQLQHEWDLGLLAQERSLGVSIVQSPVKRRPPLFSGYRVGNSLFLSLAARSPPCRRGRGARGAEALNFLPFPSLSCLPFPTEKNTDWPLSRIQSIIDRRALLFQAMRSPDAYPVDCAEIGDGWMGRSMWRERVCVDVACRPLAASPGPGRGPSEHTWHSFRRVCSLLPVHTPPHFPPRPPSLFRLFVMGAHHSLKRPFPGPLAQ